MYEILLVSKSPRRQQILSEAGFLFRVDTVNTSEIIEENVNFPEAVASLAKAKARAYLDEHNHLKLKDILVVSADTMVILGGRALGKPKNPTQAGEFLVLLSGKAHSVITGLYIENLKTGESFVGSDTTEVQFRRLSDQEIQEYIATGEPLDKAGAYAIQGLGGKFVQEISGSYLNVVGFPLELFEKTLNQKGWHVARDTTRRDR